MRHAARRFVPVRQVGQAVVEALLMLPLIAVLIWAVSGVGRLQLAAQQMSQASRKAAMSGALGQPLMTGEAFAASGLTARIAALPGVATPQIAILQDEWFGTGLQRLSVHARTPPANRHASNTNAPLALPITRHTHVAIGAGHAHGDADASRRIGNAASAWRGTQRESVAQVRRVGAMAQRVDGSWGRPTLQTDWLSAWADLIPAQRLGNRRGQSR